jgi:triphosphoribosyl-dephospho-CoA synthetase
MGMACEQAMYAATNGVNTHKGGFLPSVCSVSPPGV